MAEQIHIGFGIDKNFGRFAGITITSLVHNNIQHDLNIHIVYDELLPEDMDRLKKTEQLYRNLTLHFYQITSTEGMTFIVPPGHITQAMYYRYLFVDLLPKSVKRLIYLDADIICNIQTAVPDVCNLKLPVCAGGGYHCSPHSTQLFILRCRLPDTLVCMTDRIHQNFCRAFRLALPESSPLQGAMHNRRPGDLPFHLLQ